VARFVSATPDFKFADRTSRWCSVALALLAIAATGSTPPAAPERLLIAA
jgi:hypothetical protein